MSVKRSVKITKVLPGCLAIIMMAIAPPNIWADKGGNQGQPLPSKGICAHRGARDTHPENTLAAFREAIRLGAHMIELDIAETKDGHIVLMHDRSVDRTTNGKGKVAELTLAQIKALDAGSWKSPEFAGEQVPTLWEALAIMPTNIWINIDLKDHFALAGPIAREVIRLGRQHQTLLATKREGADNARRVCQNFLIANMNRKGGAAVYVSDTIKHGDRFIQLRKGLASTEDIRRLKDANVKINCYIGLNKPSSEEELLALFDAGVDFPIVDILQPMLEAAKKRGVEPMRY